jgi:hypothetical protein
MPVLESDRKFPPKHIVFDMPAGLMWVFRHLSRYHSFDQAALLDQFVSAIVFEDHTASLKAAVGLAVDTLKYKVRDPSLFNSEALNKIFDSFYDEIIKGMEELAYTIKTIRGYDDPLTHVRNDKYFPYLYYFHNDEIIVLSRIPHNRLRNVSCSSF